MIKPLTLLLLLATACAAGADDLEPRPSAEAALQVAAERDDDARRPAPGRGLPTPCQSLQDVGATLLAAYQQCTNDADCESEWVNATCIRAFLCPVPVNGRADLARLAREADALSFAYQEACTTSCAVAGCAQPKRTYCDGATRLCKSDYR